MPRVLVVCIDGTWNTGEETSRFKSVPSNVERITKHLVNDGKSQLVIYRPGVGTQGYLDRIRGGVWGAGATAQIYDGYRFLANSYQPGDRLALFGFSRGAFAVRSILTVLARVGLLRPDSLDQIPEAIRLARRPPRWGGMYESFHDFSEAHCRKESEWLVIEFVGVWDTVIRYGPVLRPVNAAFELIRRQHFGLFDHRIPKNVRSMCHAIALDESRAAFIPWRFEASREGLEEVWFAGSHSDVGGGYEKAGLSQISLSWIAERAAQTGVLFDTMPAVEEDSYLAEINPSQSGYWRVLPSLARTVQEADRLHEFGRTQDAHKGLSPAGDAARGPSPPIGRGVTATVPRTNWYSLRGSHR